ncbi:LytR/AlgR family response regulator transcription factor [Paludibaculum fermentans]|uniref:Response regulator transcription factor n=1 Tax=Paludibaculum fermentans TaxID=1473598 RepID=A0A7S7SJA5_PALFE|nr:LytTR family DNA-binding domain-containing protein [Paludibaculum fermentans]QOY85795.1 response regulator transcription factor [Paludibaculum fermentans]
MNVLIVDDEPIARQILRELLEEHPGVNLAGEASTGLEAVEQIARLHPDVVLLDLQMPGLDGFSVARTLRGDSLPIVIFVTAFETHALQAFDTGAVDYLLKPVRKERLTAALEKARTQIAGLKSEPPPPPPVTEPLRRILGRLGSDLHMLNPGDVIAFQADGDTVQIITAQGRYYADHSLRTLEAKLPPPQFRRIHRGTIINTDHIRKISPLTSKRWLLKMSNGLEAIVSKRMAGVIRDATRW